MMINSKPMTIDAVMEVLGYSRSYIYKLLRCGQLEYCDALRPTQVTSKSVLSHIGRRFPFPRGRHFLCNAMKLHS